MTTAYTSLLGLALPVTGELSGTWGDVVNNSITSLLDSAIAGTTNVSTDADVTLTTTTGAANTAREAILLFSGARTALRTVTAPAQSKVYTVINATTGGFAVTLVGAGPTTGVTIANGARTVVAWNGSDFVEVSSPSSIILPGGTANGVLYLNGSKVVTSGSALTFDGTNVLTLFRTTGTEANEPTIKFSNLVFAGQNAGVIKSSNGGLALDIQSPSDSTYQLRSRIYMSGGSGDSISFQASSNNGSTYGERMVLTSTGLGIGTSSPAQKLHIKSSGSTKLLINSSDNSADRGVYFASSTDSDVLGYISQEYSTGNFTISAGTGSYAVPMIFRTGGSERMRLDSSGNLGLGVTPSSWDSAFKNLQVGGSGYSGSFFSQANGDASMGVTLNGYYSSGWKYTASGKNATKYEQNAGVHSWSVAPSGTAGNAITFTQAMTLDASGRFIVGATSVTGSNQVEIQTSLTNGLWVQTGSTSSSNYVADFRTGSNASVLALRADNTALFSGNLLVGTTSSTNGKITVLKNSLYNSQSGHGLAFLSNDNNSYTSMYMGVDDTNNIGYIQTAQHNTGYGRDLAINPNGGNLLVGGTSSYGKIYARSDSTSFPNLKLQNESSTGYFANFSTNGNSTVGTISFTISGTAYNTSSDYRLKNTIAPMTGALAKVAQLKPCTYKWNADGSDGEGFIAHELAEVCPHAVTGEKDAVDADGKPVYQGIDTSFLVATLTAALQEQQAIIESLKARLDAANL